MEPGESTPFETRVEALETPAERVIHAVCAVSDTEPLDLPPLYESIDPDALDALVERAADVVVEFEYVGYDVTVTADVVLVHDSSRE